MAAQKKKIDAKTFAAQRRKRRQWLTFMRMVRYGVNNFSRNAWLTVAATAVMTITLLILFATFVASSMLNSTVSTIERKVDVSIYLDHDTPAKQADEIVNRIKKLDGVRTVSYTTPEQARKSVAEKNSGNQSVLDALNMATDQLPGTVQVNLSNLNDSAALEQFVQHDDLVKKYLDSSQPPSFSGDRKEVIQRIGGATQFVQKVGLVASFIFICISSLIIFNTIRMAIFNRRDEIQMMKLIGADRNFIRGPFVVEAVVYGFIAGIIATGLGMLVLYSIKGRLDNWISIDSTVNTMTMYIGVVLLAMIGAGAIIGIISSLLATRRYLKI